MIEALTGADTIKIDDRIIADLIDLDTVLLEYPNELANVKTGKDGNSIFAFNATGRNVNVTMRVVMGSADDKWLNSRLQEWIKDASTFVLMTGQFIKNTGDGSGNLSKNTYNLSGGVFLKIPGAKTNVEGDTEQSVVVYNLRFSNGGRAIA